jgi:hypothetical protein
MSQSQSQRASSRFLNAVHGYETTPADTRRCRRTNFSTVLTSAIGDGLITRRALQQDFDISRDQVEKARRGLSADVPRETRKALIVRLKGAFE